MALEVGRHESTPDAIHRIGVGRIEKSLEPIRVHDPEAVHEVRKQCKQVRAVLRLVRDELGDARYRHENRLFRDLSRPLSEVRDAEVLVDTLDELLAAHRRDLARGAFSGLRRALRKHLEVTRTQVLVRGHALEHALRELERARARAARWPIRHPGWKAIRPGLERVYRQGRAAFEASRAEPSDESLHEWRKQAKYLRGQLEVLEPLWPEVLEAMVRDLHELSDLLGTDHDLAVLASLARSRFSEAMKDGEPELLSAVVRTRRDALQRKARKRGRRIYANKPRLFVRSLKDHWRAWHA